MAELSKRPGYKQQEAEDRGLQALMNLPKMERAQFMQALQSRPAPAAQEKVLGGQPPKQEVIRLANANARAAAERFAQSADSFGEARQMRADELRRARESRPEILGQAEKELQNPTHHEQWTLPGGENYREMLIKAPKGGEQFPGVPQHFGGEPGILASMRLKDRFVPDLEGPHNVKVIGGGGHTNVKHPTREAAERFAEVKRQGGYKTEITPLNQKKLLHLDELQSDWHQQGREKGYAQPETSRMIGKVVDANDGTYKVEWPDGTFSGGYNLASAMEKAKQGKSNVKPGVPDAPFKKNWEEMALKKLIHHAAENGYHGVVVTPGAEQAERYNLAKHIDGIKFNKMPDGNIFWTAQKNGSRVTGGDNKPEELDSVLGKEVASQIRNRMEQGPGELSGLNLQVGGEGMKAFYDKKVPNILNSIGKKYGAKVRPGTLTVPSNNPPNTVQELVNNHGVSADQIRAMDNSQRIALLDSYRNKQAPVHMFDITPEMRKDVVKNGLPLYAEGGAIHMNKGGSDIRNLQEYIRQSKGEYGAKRVQRAADEIPGLENMYTMRALQEAFGGDNAKALMTMNPADYEKFAIRLFQDPDTREEEMNELQERGQDLPLMSHHDYIDHLAKIKGGFSDVPFLEINKKAEYLPNITGHEGRHRMRALAAKGTKKSLVRLFPNYGIREDMPRRNPEDFVEAMRQMLGERRLVTGQDRSYLPADLEAPEHKNIERRNMLGGRPQLPEIYAEGGSVPHLAIGGQGPKNWLKGSVENVIHPLKTNNKAEENLEEMRRVYPPEALATMSEETRASVNRAFPHLEKQVAINQWVDRNLANYIRKQMATHDDPIRKLAEQGIVHMPPEQMGYGSSQAEMVRKKMGAPRLGQSPEAQAWEDAADVSMLPVKIKDIEKMSHRPNVKKEPWMEKADPETPVYMPLDNMHAHYLGFDHLVDILKQDLSEGRIRPEQLSKISIEHAVRRAHQYDQERKKAMAETALKATEGMPVHKEYPEGYKWIELAKPSAYTPDTLPSRYEIRPMKNKDGGMYYSVRDMEDRGLEIGGGMTPEAAIQNSGKRIEDNRLEEALKYEGDTMGHCVGGYCPDVAAGRSRIFSLRDAKNEPHVTIEVQPNQHLNFNTWWDKQPKELRDEINARASRGEHRGSVFEAPEYLAARGALPPVIKQIKGKSNAKPKKDYIPYVQDFVKSGKWSEVGDAHNADLRKYSDVFNQNEQNKLKSLGAEFPQHGHLTGDQIQQMHNMITPEGRRLKYDQSGKIVGGEADSGYATGGSIKPIGYTKEKVTVSPNLDAMRYELESVKHYTKKAK